MTSTSTVDPPATVREDSGGAVGVLAALLLITIVIAGVVGFIRARRR